MRRIWDLEPAQALVAERVTPAQLRIERQPFARPEVDEDQPSFEVPAGLRHDRAAQRHYHRPHLDCVPRELWS